MAEAADKSELLALTAEIVAAHVSNNKLEAAELPGLIRQVYGTLAGIDGTAAASIAGPAEKLQPAVPIKKSVTPEFIRSEEHTSELQSLMRNSYAVFCLKKKNIK